MWNFAKWLYQACQVVVVLWKTYWKDVGLVHKRLSCHLQQGDVVLQPLGVEVRVDDDHNQPSLDVAVGLVDVVSMVVPEAQPQVAHI